MVPTALFAMVAGLGMKRDCLFTLLMLATTKLGKRDWNRTSASTHEEGSIELLQVLTSE